jgi:hypothetical protein
MALHCAQRLRTRRAGRNIFSSVSTMPLHLRRQPAALSQPTPDRHVLDDVTASYVSNIMWGQFVCLSILAGCQKLLRVVCQALGATASLAAFTRTGGGVLGSLWGVLGRQCERTLAWHEVSRLPVELLSCFWALR